jgi:hypothetical protein
MEQTITKEIEGKELHYSEQLKQVRKSHDSGRKHGNETVPMSLRGTILPSTPQMKKMRLDMSAVSPRAMGKKQPQIVTAQ